MKRKEFVLEPSGIDMIADLICEEMTRLKADKKDMLRLRLSVEDALLIWMGDLGEGVVCNIRYGKRHNIFAITLRCKGRKCNPLLETEELEEQDETESMVNMLLHLNLAPTYAYRYGINSLVFQVTVKEEQIPIGVIVAILAAVLSFFVFQYTPPVVGETVSAYITYPLQEILLSGISMVTGPLLFLAVVTGIICADNVGTIRQRGGVMLSSFTLQMIFAAILTVLFCFLGFEYQWATGGDSGLSASVFLEVLVDIVPTSIFAPFTNSNALQLVFLAILTGVVLLIARDKTEGLCSVIDQIYTVFSVMMGWIAKLLPIFIYCTLVNILMENSNMEIASFAFLICIVLALIILYAVIMFVKVVVTCKMSPKILFKKLLPSFILVLTTGSSTATFWHTKKVCIEQLGVQEDCTNTSLPLGSVLYMPTCVILFTAAALYTASAYQTSVSITFFVLLIFLSVIMTMAMPPVAGSEIMCLTGLFMGLGIDTAGVPLIVALTVIINAALAAGNILCLELTLVSGAKKLGEINENVLHNEII